MQPLADTDPRALALVAALRGGDVEAVRAQLSATPGLAGARIVDAGGVGRTPLHVLADWPGHAPRAAEAVAALVAAGADVDARLVGGSAPETPLHWAASSDDVALLDALLDAGADLEAPGAVLTGGTPLADAVVFAQWRAARRLLERGARTTLWQAAALGLVERVAAALAGAPPPDAAAITNALWHACRGGQQPTAALLVAAGADVRWRGHDGHTPLDLARAAGWSLA